MTTTEDIMHVECKVIQCATDFAMLVEGITQEMTPVLCSDAEFIYSKLNQCAGLLADFREALFPPKDWQNVPEGTVLWSWTPEN